MSYSKNSFKNKKCTVLGLGISNLPLIDYLYNAGAIIEARDKKSPADIPDTAKKLNEMNIPFLYGEGYLNDIDAHYIFRSPGIRPDHPEIEKAVKKGAVLLSEMELFIDMCPCPIVAITGSDGKTTTSTLTAKLLEQGGYKVYLGGNIGKPLLSECENINENDVVVLELSSFQLMTLKKSPEYAAITNISPNHLDWHKGMEEYIEAKANIFKNKGNKKLILNGGNPPSLPYAGMTSSQIKYFSASVNADYHLKDGYIMCGEDRILDTSSIVLPGIHNVENYMTAIALTADFGITKQDIAAVASTFPGVEHRLEYVRSFEGVKYYNSSIDSSPTRTAAALSALNSNPIVICGGYDKNIPFDALATALIKYAKAVILTGNTANKINAALKAAGAELNVYLQPEFDDAVFMAKEIAKQGDTVILSPACASFDRFKNFEVRGRHFKDLVNNF